MIKLINRPAYTDRIVPFINKNIIKVLTGQRRVGKSCILSQLHQHISKYVVSLDEWTSSSCVNGINHLHLTEFLKL